MLADAGIAFDGARAIQLALAPAFLLTGIAGMLFTAATIALVVGLTYFLREVYLAAQTVRIELRSATHKPPESPKPNAARKSDRT
jgi:hypothetical protein